MCRPRSTKSKPVHFENYDLEEAVEFREKLERRENLREQLDWLVFKLEL